MCHGETFEDLTEVSERLMRERERERERKGCDKVREREVPGGKVFKIKVGLLAFGATAADRNKVDDQVEGVPNKMKFVPWWLW